jgi:hypothetical protein
MMIDTIDNGKARAVIDDKLMINNAYDTNAI